jgi:NAD(P) transhydrogenase subunit alpha
MLREGSDLMAFLHPASPSNLDMVQRLAERNIRSFTLDSIPRIPEARKMDALASMSRVAGYKSVIMAVDRIPRFACGISTPVGDLEPARALVVGVGAVGAEAISTALRLGMQVTAFDVHPNGTQRAKALGAAAIDLSVPLDVLTDEEGHPQPLSAEWCEKIRNVLGGPVGAADVVILSALIRGETAPILVTGPMVRSMRSGSVIVDVSIDQGGNCEVTKPGEIIDLEGVTVMGIKNIPGRLRNHSTVLFARNVLHFFQYLAKGGRIRADLADEIVRSTLVTSAGRILHEGTLHALARRNKA